MYNNFLLIISSKKVLSKRPLILHNYIYIYIYIYIINHLSFDLKLFDKLELELMRLRLRCKIFEVRVKASLEGALDKDKDFPMLLLFVICITFGFCSNAYWNTITTQSLQSSSTLRQHLSSTSLTWNVLLLNIDSQEDLWKFENFENPWFKLI